MKKGSAFSDIGSLYLEQGTISADGPVYAPAVDLKKYNSVRISWFFSDLSGVAGTTTIDLILEHCDAEDDGTGQPESPIWLDTETDDILGPVDANGIFYTITNGIYKQLATDGSDLITTQGEFIYPVGYRGGLRWLRPSIDVNGLTSGTFFAAAMAHFMHIHTGVLTKLYKFKGSN